VLVGTVSAGSHGTMLVSGGGWFQVEARVQCWPGTVSGGGQGRMLISGGGQGTVLALNSFSWEQVENAGLGGDQGTVLVWDSFS